MKGIMFNEHCGLESAVLSGLKTMTRRVINGTFNNADVAGFIAYNKNTNISQYTIRVDFTDGSFLDSPYDIGEIVAIKQSYEAIKHQIPCYGDVFMDNNINISNAGYYNKMFVKNDLMPHQIKITNVRVERLQDISEEDCLDEGIRCNSAGSYYYSATYCLDPDPRAVFASLINNVRGKGTWQSNPFVWVIEFELLKGGAK